MAQVKVLARTRSKWAVLAAAATSTLLGTSDFSIVAIALPSLTSVFQTSTSIAVWIALSYQLMVLGLVLPMGRLGDLIGLRTVFASGILVYSVGLTNASLAPNVLVLIVMRALQGCGAAMMVSLSIALVTNAFPAKERGRALGLMASVAGVGLMAGPALGGILLDTFGWRSIFWARAPLGYIGFIVALIALDNARIPAGRRLDFLGSGILFSALVLLAVGLNRGSVEGWTSLIVLSALVLSAGAFTLYASRALRVESPIIDPRMFRDRRLSLSSGLMLMAGTSMMAITFLMPFYLVWGKGLSPTIAGFVLLTNPVLFVLLPPLTGRLADRIGSNIPTSIGLALQASSLFLISTLTTESTILTVVAMLATFGIGGALFQAPNQSVIMGAAPHDRVGTVSALIPTIRYMGLIVGVALTEAVFTSALGGQGLADAGPEAVVHAIRTTAIVFGAIAGGAAILSFARKRVRTAEAA